MPKKSPQKPKKPSKRVILYSPAAERIPRIPLKVEDIQVNSCRSVWCQNFGSEPYEFVTRGQVHAGSIRDGYNVIGREKRGWRRKTLLCTFCGSAVIFKSNLAVSEELDRIWEPYRAAPDTACCTDGCQHYGKGIDRYPALYRTHGKTSAGAQRFKCLACNKTVSEARAWHKQAKPHLNKLVFKLLVNKSPIRGISRVTDLSPKSVYDKISFLEKQCIAFASERERDMGSKINERMYISSDRQDYVINWTDRENRKNVKLTSIGSCDNFSGYILGMHLNFDATVDIAEAEKHAQAIGDPRLEEPAFRRYARIWLSTDFRQSTRISPMTRDAELDEQPGVHGRIKRAQEDREKVEDPEADEKLVRLLKLPKAGAQVHYEYTVHAHFRLLRRLLSGVPRYAFYMDEDDTIRAGCLASFGWEFKNGDADGFYVSIEKRFTVDHRRDLVKASAALIKATRAKLKRPEMTDWEVRLHLIQRELKKLPRQFQRGRKSNWRNRWLKYPIDTLAEPERYVQHISNRGDLNDAQLATLYARASLHGIDQYFMQVRRLLSMLERPIKTPSNANRTWHGYSPYNPAVVQKLLNIHRIYFNYIKVGKDKKTPAMRIGLAKGPVRFEDVIYYGRHDRDARVA